MTRPSAIQMPPLASPQPQPTFLGTPFATPSTQSPFEYPFAASAPSPDNHCSGPVPHTTSPKPVMPSRSPPMPPTLLMKGRERAKTAGPEGGPVMADSTRIARLEALAREQQIQQAGRRRGSFA